MSIIAVLGITVPSGCGGGGGSSATPAPTLGRVEIGFADSPSSEFQRILLNVVSVRLNPSADTTISPVDVNWVTIPAPSAFGSAAELQIDLLAARDNVQLFSSHAVPVQTYNQVEVILDPNHPGFVVPNCPGASPFNEGCLSYPFQLPIDARDLRLKAPVPVTSQGLSTLVIEFGVTDGSVTAPSAPGGVYTLTPSLSIPGSDLLGTITGNVKNGRAGTSVSAELSGTGTVVARAGVQSGGNFKLDLPAASDGGTPYDIFVSGGSVTYAAASSLPVTRGGNLQGQNFTVNPTSTGQISGKIIDTLTKAPIQGATLSLLVRPENNLGAVCATTPTDCVVVATASTDENGHYPLPGNIFAPPPFSQVPLGPYTLEVSAAGYDTILASAPVTSGANAVCGAPNTSTTNCSFALTSNLITGTVSVDSPVPAGSEEQVMIAAETSGTNQLQNVTLATIGAGLESAPFSINVPTTLPNLPVPTFDLFATAQDFFNGAPSPFPGHTIEVQSGVTAGGAPTALGPLTCVGHASVSGTVNPPFDSGTTVRVSKNNVQLMESTVGPAGEFSFCAPGDTYTFTRYEKVNGTPMPTGSPIATMLPTPVPMPTPCQGICGLSSGGCPGVCQPGVLPAL